MKLRSLLFASLAAFLVALPTTAAHALLVKVSVNFGPTITGPENGTLVVTANPGDMLRITWALGTDTSIGRYDGLISGVDTTEITRFGGFALELTGASTPPATRTPPFPEESSSIARRRTVLPPVSLGMVVSCGGSTTWSRLLFLTRART